ncbi:MAG: hypothetical protein WAO52_17655 [Prolixibacteraceae bacterium]
MEFSNQKRSKKIKQTFNLIGIIIVLIGLAFLWMKKDTLVLITAGVFAVYVGISQFANLCYFYINTNNGKVLIRYYPIITLMKKEFDSIEFNHQLLVNFRIEKSMGFSDLDIAIRAKRGIAEYPTISLAALKKEEIEQIRQALLEIMKNNN